MKAMKEGTVSSSCCTSEVICSRRLYSEHISYNLQREDGSEQGEGDLVKTTASLHVGRSAACGTPLLSSHFKLT